MTPRRAAVLREMGLGPLWRLRSRGAAAEMEAETLLADTAASDLRVGVAETSVPTVVPAMAKQAARSGASVPALSPPPSTSSAQAPMPAVADPRASTAGDPERAARIASLDWEALEADIRACTACGLCERRRQAVPGVGDRRAQWMLVGEGPGAEEDQRGEPFVGAAGKLLDAMLAAIGLRRGENVYIANAVKCRPPHNRTPEGEEIAACLPYLERQIELVRPRVLIALGRPAAQALLNAEVRIGAARARVHRRGDLPVVVTYHPAYLLRNQADKGKAWEDLCFARRVMREQTGS